ncbi:XVIPCD domain-containing protein, partial [Dyella silvatica]|uniref:XVIPCD domain-containing protein n=1 Tax=Dyella silvatica TaxID=2992128 RepID=UPI002B1CBA7A
FTKHAMELGKDYDQKHGLPFNATVTGHSLGGALTEITAYRYGLHGETFNGYGAAGLIQGIPEGGHQVINHVRATDVVSAASKHFGETHTYASQQDLDTLNKAGYHDGMSALSVRNPVKGIDFDAHSATNFLPNNPRLGHSIISPENEALYGAHKGMIDRYRNDVQDARTVISANWEVPKAVGVGAVATGEYVKEKVLQGAQVGEQAVHVAGHAAVQAYDATRDKVVQGVHATEQVAQQAYDYTRDKAVQGVHATERAAQYVGHQAHQAYDASRQAAVQGVQTVQHTATEAAQSATHAMQAAGAAVSRETSQAYDTLSHPGSWFQNKPAAAPPRLDHPDHPDHAMFKQACAGVHQLDAEHGRKPDQHSTNLAGALTVAAKAGGMTRIDGVALSEDGSRAYAAQHAIGRALTTTAHVQTAQAVNTPLEKSSDALQQAAQQQTHAQAHASLMRVAMLMRGTVVVRCAVNETLK